MTLFTKILTGIITVGLIHFGVFHSTPSKSAIKISQPIPSSFSVNAGGALNWSMDIDVPPGIKDIQPNLSINYTSQNVSGLLGIGFDLNGLSEITRTGATLAQDGFFGGVSYSASDRFQLDGNRLMLMQGNAYGAANSVCHTQSESWTKVVALGQSGSGPQSFQIWTKNGMYFEYGNTPDARVAALSANGSPVYPAGSIRQWLVNKCQDLHGNTLTVSYTQTPPDSSGKAIAACTGQGQTYPLRIDYTSNVGVAALRSVQFVYEQRPDSSTAFIGGSKFSTRARMTAIRTFVKDTKGDSTLVREVRLTYDKKAPLNASRIAAIGVKGGNFAYAPTVFDWSEGQDTLLPKNITWPGTGNNEGFVGDFNGDGKNDILQTNEHVYFGTSSGFVDAGNSGILYDTNATSAYNFVGDFNGDGISDFLAASSGGGTIYYYNQQSKTFSSSKPVSGMLIGAGCYPNKCVWQGDFNGDGLSDICSAMGTAVYVNFGNATNGLNPYLTQSGLAVEAGNTYAADFNGDGLTDLFSCNPQTGYLTISNWSDSTTTGFRKTMTIPNMNFTISSTQSYTWIGDYNGDGLADILAKGTDENYRVYYANGNGFQAGKIISINLATTAVWPADFNHDGQMDFYAASSNNGTIYLSNGLDFTSQENVNYSFQPSNTWLGDFNGDGLTDLFNAFTKQVYYGGNSTAANQSINQQGNLITGIHNGIGSTIEFTYQPITDSTVYVAGNSSAISALEGQRVLNAYNAVPLSSVQNQSYGTISIQQAMFVVSDWTVTDGRGAKYGYNSVYAGAKYDLTGYGFLGYAQITTTDLNQGEVEQTYYLQGFPFSGMTDSSVTLDIHGKLYEALSFVWDSVPISSASSVPVYQVLQKTQNTYLFNQQALACHGQLQNWFDPFGNAIKSANTGNVAQPATVWTFTTFDNDTTNWQLGYVTSSKQCSDSSGTQYLSAAKLKYTVAKDVDSLYIWFSSNNTWLTHSFGYDQFGNKLFQTSYAGDTSSVVFDSIYHCYPVRSYAPRNAQGVRLSTTSKYEPFYGNEIQSTDVNGNVFQYKYDGLGRFTQAWIPGPGGKQTLVCAQSFLPTKTGYIVQQSNRHDWSGQRIDTAYTYFDGLSRPYQSKNLGWKNQSVYIQQQYNASDQVVASSLPYFAGAKPIWNHVTYDPIGRTIQTVVPFENSDSIITRIQYQGLSTQVIRAAATPDSTISTYTYAYYNSQSCIVNFVNAAGIPTTYTWDLLGRIRSATDVKGNTMASDWNSLNQNDWFYSSSFDTTFFHYQPIQQTDFVVNALNDTLFTAYDNLGRPISSKASGMAPTTYQYDLSSVKNGLGNLCQVVQDNGATQYGFTYDALGNAVGEQIQLDGKKWKQTFAYNPDNSLAVMKFPNTMGAQWVYNRAGQAIAVNQLVAKRKPKAITKVNNANSSGNWLQYTYGNGLVTQKSFYTDETLQSMQVASNNSTTYWSKTYQWNKQGLISSISDLTKSTESESYSYSPTGRLTLVQTPARKDSMAYDQVGNLIWNDSIAFGYKGYQVQSGVYKSKTIYTATYNSAGQQYKRTIQAQATSHAYTYKYNGYGKIDSVYRNDTLVMVYTYDYTGTRNRVKDLLKNTINYQVSDTYSELITGSSVHSSYNFDMGGAVFAAFSNADSVEYYSCNQTGSTVLVTSANGKLVQRLDYAPFGKFKKAGTSSAHAQYKFNGQEFDEGSGLYYFNFRYYDPFTCRFNSPDDQLGGSLTTPDALNNYAFVNNSPITLSDPSGHMPKGTKVAKGIEKVIKVGATDATIEAITDGTGTAAVIAVDAKLIIKASEKTIKATAESTVSKAIEDEALSTPEPTTKSGTAARRYPTRRSTIKKETSINDYSAERTKSNKRKREIAFDDDDDDGGDDGGDDDDLDYKATVTRPGFTPGQREEVYKAAKKNGRVFCDRGCNTELLNTKTHTVGRKKRKVIDWQMGHRTGYEHVHLYKLYTDRHITEYIYKRAYKDSRFYAPECPKCNQSHRSESRKSLYNASDLKKRYDRKTSFYMPKSFFLPKRKDPGFPLHSRYKRIWMARTENYRTDIPHYWTFCSEDLNCPRPQPDVVELRKKGAFSAALC